MIFVNKIVNKANKESESMTIRDAMKTALEGGSASVISSPANSISADAFLCPSVSDCEQVGVIVEQFSYTNTLEPEKKYLFTFKPCEETDFICVSIKEV